MEDLGQAVQGSQGAVPGHAVKLTDEERARAWTAAQAIYDAMPDYDAADILAAAMSEIAGPQYFTPHSQGVVMEIASHLWTLHDEDMK